MSKVQELAHYRTTDGHLWEVEDSAGLWQHWLNLKSQIADRMRDHKGAQQALIDLENSLKIALNGDLLEGDINSLFCAEGEDEGS